MASDWPHNRQPSDRSPRTSPWRQHTAKTIPETNPLLAWLLRQQVAAAATSFPAPTGTYYRPAPGADTPLYQVPQQPPQRSSPLVWHPTPSFRPPGDASPQKSQALVVSPAAAHSPVTTYPAPAHFPATTYYVSGSRIGATIPTRYERPIVRFRPHSQHTPESPLSILTPQPLPVRQKATPSQSHLHVRPSSCVEPAAQPRQTHIPPAPAPPHRELTSYLTDDQQPSGGSKRRRATPDFAASSTQHSDTSSESLSSSESGIKSDEEESDCSSSESSAPSENSSSSSSNRSRCLSNSRSSGSDDRGSSGSDSSSSGEDRKVEHMDSSSSSDFSSGSGSPEGHNFGAWVPLNDKPRSNSTLVERDRSLKVWSSRQRLPAFRASRLNSCDTSSSSSTLQSGLDASTATTSTPLVENSRSGTSARRPLQSTANSRASAPPTKSSKRKKSKRGSGFAEKVFEHYMRSGSCPYLLGDSSAATKREAEEDVHHTYVHSPAARLVEGSVAGSEASAFRDPSPSGPVVKETEIQMSLYDRNVDRTPMPPAVPEDDRRTREVVKDTQRIVANVALADEIEAELMQREQQGAKSADLAASPKPDDDEFVSQMRKEADRLRKEADAKMAKTLKVLEEEEGKAAKKHFGCLHSLVSADRTFEYLTVGNHGTVSMALRIDSVGVTDPAFVQNIKRPSLLYAIVRLGGMELNCRFSGSPWSPEELRNRLLMVAGSPTAVDPSSGKIAGGVIWMDTFNFPYLNEKFISVAIRIKESGEDAPGGSDHFLGAVRIDLETAVLTRATQVLQHIQMFGHGDSRNCCATLTLIPSAEVVAVPYISLRAREMDPEAAALVGEVRRSYMESCETEKPTPTSKPGHSRAQSLVAEEEAPTEEEEDSRPEPLRRRRQTIGHLPSAEPSEDSDDEHVSANPPSFLDINGPVVAAATTPTDSAVGEGSLDLMVRDALKATNFKHLSLLDSEAVGLRLYLVSLRGLKIGPRTRKAKLRVACEVISRPGTSLCSKSTQAKRVQIQTTRKNRLFAFVDFHCPLIVPFSAEDSKCLRFDLYDDSTSPSELLGTAEMSVVGIILTSNSDTVHGHKIEVFNEHKRRVSYLLCGIQTVNDADGLEPPEPIQLAKFAHGSREWPPSGCVVTIEKCARLFLPDVEDEMLRPYVVIKLGKYEARTIVGCGSSYRWNVQGSKFAFYFHDEPLEDSSLLILECFHKGDDDIDRLIGLSILPLVELKGFESTDTFVGNMRVRRLAEGTHAGILSVLIVLER